MSFEISHLRLGRGARFCHQLLHRLYYSVLFGRPVAKASGLGRAVRTYEIAMQLNDFPASKETWDFQYGDGQWEYMRHLDECARYSAIVGYFQYLKPGGAILDIGCGEGILNERLRRTYSRYVGVDISKSAIEKCARGGSRSEYVAADATEYVPQGLFDAIVFNEVLYYFEEPLEVLDRYRLNLKPDGIFILSFYALSRRSAAVWKKVRSRYHLLHEVKISTVSEKTWICDVVAPIAEP